MEINAEITKVLGKEMANLISATISEDELKNTAIKSWNILTDHPSEGYWNSRCKPSEIENLVKEELIKRIAVEVNAILDSPEGQEEVKKDAEMIVQEIRKKAKEKMIEGVSDRIAQMTTGYAGFGIRNMVADIVDDMIGGRR